MAASQPPAAPHAALMQQLDRFQGAHRYHGKQLLQELTFVVSIWRAPLIEEERREQLCQLRFHWGEKIPSPAERMVDLQQWVRNVAASPSTVGGGSGMQQQQQSNGGASAAGAIPIDNGDVEMTMPTVLAADNAETPQHPTLTALMSLDAPPEASNADRLAQYCDLGHHMFFTRPPSEDFVDPTEFISPLEPEQATSPLAAIVLSNHRTEHRGNPNMHLMWALGHAERRPSEFAPRPSPPAAAGVPLDLCDVVWRGEEVVFCTISRLANSDTAFLAKPSLNDEHTLLVTSKHMYTFQVSVMERPAAVAPGVGGGGGHPLDRVSSAGPRASIATTSSGNLTGEVGRLVASGAHAVFDYNTPLYVTDATERERRTLLRQAILRGRATRAASAHVTVGGGALLGRGGTALTHRTNPADAPFTAPPPIGDGTDKHPEMKRVHIMGTVETASGVHCDSLVLRMRWKLPEGARLDEESLGGGKGTVGEDGLVITSQLAFGARVVNAEYAYDTVHHFNLPFELHVLMPVAGKRDVSAIFTLYSRGSGGDEYAEPRGYGSAWFTGQPGRRAKETIGLWLPRKTGYEFLRSIFIGGGPSLADDDILALPATTSGSSSRLGLVCESSGSLHFGYNVVVHDNSVPSTAATPGQAAAAPPPPRTSSLYLQRGGSGASASLAAPLANAKPPGTASQLVAGFDPSSERAKAKRSKSENGGRVSSRPKSK